jgi:hypothetical protein
MRWRIAASTNVSNRAYNVLTEIVVCSALAFFFIMVRR